ncbi:MAG: hypothetical protein AB1505_27320 [Candidatus Latescibacterota bacterium]
MEPRLQFVPGGRKRYLEALQREETQRLGEIGRTLAEERDPEVRRSLQEQIELVQEEYRRKRRAVGRGLFAGHL